MKLLLDVHIPAAVVNALRLKFALVDVAHVSNWRGGALREADDADILSACARDGRIFVTYDLSTVPDLLNAWAEEGRYHAGVVLADVASVPPEQVGRVAKAIATLLKEIQGTETANLVRFLQDPRSERHGD